jgi:hypothetical protein
LNSITTVSLPLSSQAVFPQNLQTIQLLDDDIIEIKVQAVAYGGEVEKVSADILFQDVAAGAAELSLHMCAHELFNVFQLNSFGIILLGCVNPNAAALGDSLGYGSVDPCIGILKLGDAIEYALVPDQKLRNGVLEAVDGRIFHSAQFLIPPYIKMTVLLQTSKTLSQL